MRFNLTRDFYIPKDSTILHEQPGAIVYGYDSHSRPAAIAFRGKAQKPAWFYWFKTEQARQDYIESWLKGIKASAD